MANSGQPTLWLVALFLAGTVLMRAAGCVVNDIADRNIDLHVTRTKERPLTCGRVSLKEAFFILAILLALSFIILMQLPKACFYYALAALFITCLYPFCKRLISSPQVILSLAFSMGMPMAYVASGVALDKNLLCLAAINILWTVMYDTQYAMADREDDLRIGVRSTAILFASWDRAFIVSMQAIIQVLWLYFPSQLAFPEWFMACWTAGLLIFIYQNYLLYQGQAKNYLHAFKSNGYYGLLMWLGLFFG